MTLLVPLSHSVNPTIHGSKDIWSFAPTRNTGEIGYDERRYTPKQVPFKTCRESTEIEMKFHFSVIGHAEAESEGLMVEWLQDIFREYNERSGSPVDSFQVLVREETEND